MNKLDGDLYLNFEERESIESIKISQKTCTNIKEVLDEVDEISFVIQKIKELNPMIEIKTGIDRTIIFSSVYVEDLVLPDGFYYSEINGITNKHITDSENYISIRVYPLAYYDGSFI